MPQALPLKSRIEAYAGAQPEGVLSGRIRESIRKVIDLLPLELLTPSATLIANTGMGRDVKDKKVIGVGGAYQAREVPAWDSLKYADSGSIYFATPRSAVYYFEGSQLHTIPEDLDIYVVDYSGVAETDTAINCLPPQFAEAVILDVAIGLLQSQLSQASQGPFAFDIKGEASSGGGIVELVYPKEVSDLSLIWNDVEGIAPEFSTEITNGLSSLKESLETVKQEIETQLGTPNEDIELGIARLNHAKSLLDEYVAQSDILFKRILSDSEIDKLNKVKAYEKSIEASHNAIALSSYELQRFTSHAQLLLAEHKENLERSGLLIQTIQTLTARFISFFAPFGVQGDKK